MTRTIDTEPLTAAQPTTTREDLITVSAGTWLIVGLFLDGYAHQHLLTGTESFITPWHGVFYSGFAAASAWLTFLVARRPGPVVRDRIPAGYAAALGGLVVFGLAGIGDGVWHTAFGVEVGIDALLSPTHLGLMAGMMAIVTAPYRATVASRDRGKRLVALLSLGVGVALAAFFLNFVWGLGDGGFRVAYEPTTGAGETSVIAGVATALVTTLALCIAVTLALRLGRPPFGAFTLMFAAVAGAVHLAFDEEVIGVVAATVAGLVVDAALGRAPHRRPTVVLPSSVAVMWTVYFGVGWVLGDLAWPTEIWSGTVVLTTLVAALMGHLGSMVPTYPGRGMEHL